MAGQATPMRLPTPGVYLGEFRIRRFDISNESECREYEKIRTKANKQKSGIVIEQIRDLNEVTELTDSDGNRTRRERWFIVVSWWDKSAETEEPEPPNDKQVFYIERGAKVEEE